MFIYHALQNVLLPTEVEAVLKHKDHKPNFVLNVLTQAVQALPASEAQKLSMDGTLNSFHQAVGTCERMLKTPIPRSYTRCVHTQGISSQACASLPV